MLDLRSATHPTWVDVVFSDFDAFLIDHSACERKAAATGMALLARFPQQAALVEPLVSFAQEEMEHFRIVWRIMQSRGLCAPRDTSDPYVAELRRAARGASPSPLLAQLLVAGVIEARSCERLQLVAERLPSSNAPELAETYRELTRAEARHHGLFFRLARELCGEEQARRAADRLLDDEARILVRMPERPAVH